MTFFQLTRDSTTLDDETLAPHIEAVELSPAAVLADVADWIVTSGYLDGVPPHEEWALRLNSRVGPTVARLVPRTKGELDFVWLADNHHPLFGVGSLHLERQAPGQTSEED